MHGRRRGRRREWDLMRNCCVRVNGRQEKWRLWRIHFFADLSLSRRSLARQFALAATANGLAVNLVRLCCGGVLRLLQVPLPSSSLFGKIESQQRRAGQSFLVLRERNSAEMARVGNAPAARTRACAYYGQFQKRSEGRSKVGGAQNHH